jgi:division protein CdvB (Snf7/Vps24/ESCRT-III family)
MKVVFTSTDPMEIKRIAKSLDMAIALFDIVNNAHRHKETLEDYKEAIHKILDEQGINIEELIE